MEASQLALILEKAVTIAIIMGVTLLCAKLTKRVLSTLETRNQDKAHAYSGNYRFFKHVIEGIIYFFGIAFAISTIPVFKSIALTVIASSGVLALVIGFASQQAFSNIISGFFLWIFKPFAIGDYIHLKEISGIVDDITLRHTIIKTVQNKHVMIPNSIINSEIIENSSWSDTKIRFNLDVYLSYETNLDHAVELIQSILKSDNNSLIDVKVLQLSPAYIHVQIPIWVDNESEISQVKTQSYIAIKKAFDQAGIKFARCYCNSQI